MKRGTIVSAAWLALAGCRKSAPEPAESAERPVELSPASRQVWRAFVDERCTERPPCRGCGEAKPFKDVEVPTADDPRAAADWIRSVVPDVVDSTYHPLWRYEFWELFDALPAAEQKGLLPEVRSLAWDPFADAAGQRDWSQSAWTKLAQLGDTEAIPRLREVLADERDWVAQGQAALALAAFGPRAATAENDLKRVARTHWSAELRTVAAHAAERIYDEAAELPDPTRPTRNPKHPRMRTSAVHRDRVVRVERQREPWSFELDGRRVEFSSDPLGRDPLPDALLEVELAARFPEIPGIADWASKVTVVRPLAGGWLLGTDVGEFGGDGWWIGPEGQIQHLVHTNIIGSIELGGEVYLLQGLRHLSINIGALYRVRDDNGRIAVTHAFELPEGPYDHHVDGGRLYVATKDGVGVLTSDLEFALHPFATGSDAPSRPPRGYMDGVVRVVGEHEAEVQRCLAPLKGQTQGCDARIVPGAALWFEVDGRGAVTATHPFARREEPERRPPTPEVAECLAAAASGWTFPSHGEGVVSFGHVFEWVE